MKERTFMKQLMNLELISEEKLDFPYGTTCMYQISNIPIGEQKTIIANRLEISIEQIEHVRIFVFHGVDGDENTDVWLCTGEHELDFIADRDKCDNTKNISWITQEVNQWLWS